MSKITITVSGPVGIGKSAVCMKMEILLKHLGCQVEWIGGQEEKNLTLEEWSEAHKTPIEIVERNERTEKVYETYSGQEGWKKVTQEEYDRTKDQYEHRIRRVPVQDVESGDGPCVELDGCPTEKAVLQRFWRAHAGHPPQLIDQAKLDELLSIHSEWTPYGFAIVDSHRQKFAKDLLALVSAKATSRDEVEKENGGYPPRRKLPFQHLVDQEPTGFMMKHKCGADRGFAWKKDDQEFSEDWARIGLYTEEQLHEALTRADHDYNIRAKNWRTAFEAMHKRAMKAEATLANYSNLVELAQPVFTTQEAMREVAQDIAKMSPEEIRAEHEAARELLPCPFCGGGATMHERCTDDGTPFFVSCNDCGIEVAYDKTSEGSKAKWNTRFNG